MTRLSGTLRFRLTVLFVCIFGALQVVVWMTMETMRSRSLRNQFDHQLITRAQSMMEAIDGALDAEQTAPVETRLEEACRPFEIGGTFFEVKLESFPDPIRSPNLRGFHLPAAPPGSESGAAPIAGEISDALVGPDEQLRLVTLEHTAPSGETYIVQVAASLARIKSANRQLRQILAVAFLVSLILAGLTSWFMASRAMAPVESIAIQARQIADGQLSDRISVSHASGEIGQMAEAVNEMLERLKVELQSHERFVVDVSHELKTPLTVLLGEARALSREAGESSPASRFAQQVERDTRRLLRTIESFLILAQVRAGRRPRLSTQVSIEEFVLAATQRCSREAKENSVRLVPSFEMNGQGVEPVVLGDSDLLRSMLENVIFNAIRFSPKGGSVRVSVIMSPKEGEISIRDQGPGIPQGVLPHVFDLYCQGEAEGRRTGSAGIGLSIAQSVAHLHGGEITARNHPEGGSEFTIQIPLAGD